MSNISFLCDFSRIFWWKLNHERGVHLSMIDMIMHVKHRSTFKYFNDFAIFVQEEGDLEACFDILKPCFRHIIHRAKPSLKFGMQYWLDLS
jgi:hypothetical protein